MKNFVIGGLAVVALASLTGNVLLYERYSPSRPLVRVGSDVITKKQYQDLVDYQTQGAILKKMVFADLVNQAAAKAGLTPSEKDVDARIADIRRRSPDMLAGADQDATKMGMIRDNVKTDIALENLRIRGISVTDAEVADFYAKNKKAFALPVQIKTTLVVAQNSVDAGTAADLLRQNTPLDILARQPRLRVAGMDGFNPDFRALPPAVSRGISSQVFGMKPGDVKIIPLGSQFLVIKARQNDGAGVPPLSQIRGQVTRFAKLQKAPGTAQEIVNLYHGTDVTFEVDKYSAYFGDVQNAASHDNSNKTASLP